MANHKKPRPAGYHVSRPCGKKGTGPGPVYIPIEHLARGGCAATTRQAVSESYRLFSAGLVQN